MSEKSSPEALIAQLENYVGCWKEFHRYIQIAASNKYTSEDEEHFLELKSLLVQQLEVILSKTEARGLNRQELHDLVGNVPSLRYLTDARDDTLRATENKWHKVYIAWQSVLGQLKVEQRAHKARGGGLSGWFR